MRTRSLAQWRMRFSIARLPVLALVLGVGAASSQAAGGRSCGGVSFPGTLTLGGTTLELNGLGLREATVFAVDVFVAALYVQHRSSDPKLLLSRDEPTRVILHFVRDTGADTVADEMDAAYRANAKKDFAAEKKQLFGWLQDFSVGQSLSFSYQPEQGLEVRVAGRVKGVIAGREFASATLAVLIGRTVADEDLRAGLLGGSCR